MAWKKVSRVDGLKLRFRSGKCWAEMNMKHFSFCLAPSLWSWWFFIGQMNLCWCIISETWWKQLQWLCWANRTLRENGNVEKYFASISIRQSSIIRCDHCPVSAPAPTLAKTAINKVRNTGLDTSEVFSLHFDRTWIF